MLPEGDLYVYLYAWWKTCRRTWKVLWRTRTNIISVLCNNMSFKKILLSRTMKFYQSCFLSENTHISFMIRNAMTMFHNTVSKNIRFLMYKLNILTENIVKQSFNNLYSKLPKND